MGMYTEIYVNIDLIKDTPESVLAVLEAMCNKDYDAVCLKDKPSRWGYMFNSGSYYTPNTACGILFQDAFTKEYSLLAKGDIKNYGGEIEEFFKYISPYAYDDFMGYMRYEEDRGPILVFKGDFDND